MFFKVRNRVDFVLIACRKWQTTVDFTDDDIEDQKEVVETTLSTENRQQVESEPTVPGEVVRIQNDVTNSELTVGLPGDVVRIQNDVTDSEQTVPGEVVRIHDVTDTSELTVPGEVVQMQNDVTNSEQTVPGEVDWIHDVTDTSEPTVPGEREQNESMESEVVNIETAKETTETSHVTTSEQEERQTFVIRGK